MRRTAVLAIALALSGTAALAQLKAQVPTTSPNAPAMQPMQQAQPTLESARRIPRDKAIELVKEGKAVFVDVRGTEAYNAGHIKGALDIPEFELIQRLKEIPPGKMIITYCA